MTIKEKLNALISASNNTTGDSSTNLTDAVQSLIDGYGGGPTPPSPSTTSAGVKFYDYDGTVVYSYSKEEFAELSSMPANPTHEGLTAQGWNWSLSDAKTYVSEYGKLNIGQMYITSDGKTRLYISLPEGRISPILQLYLNANSELDIDWGDGGTHSTFTSTSSAEYKSERHEYATAGDYVIAITVVSGGFELQSSSSTIVSSILWNGSTSSSSPDRAYNSAIKKIEIGNGVTNIGSNAFYNCSSLSSITVPNSVTNIENGTFYYCYSLSSVTIPNSVTSIENNVFNSCSSLSSITVPNSVTSIGDNAFSGCTSLSSVTIPNSVTTIGENAFKSCSSLSSATIGNGVTGIIGFYAFQNCSSLSSATIGNGVTGIGDNVFQYCYSLSSITIPNSVTSIGYYAFKNCSSLSSATIGNGVTSIGGYAFQNCSYMSYIKFESTTPPTVASSNAWSGVSTSTKILVPSGTLATYKRATGYPNPSTYTYEEY